MMVERFKFLYKLFQFVGFAPIAVTPKNVKMNNFYDNIVNLIPTMLTTIVSIFVTYFLLIHPHFESYGPIHGIINSASVFSLLMIATTGNGRCFLSKSVHRNINHKIRQIEQKMHAGAPIDNLKPFANVYKLKMFCIFFLFFLSQGLVFYESSLASSAGMLSSFFTSLFRFIFPTAVLHVVLYSDIVANCMHRVNMKLKHSSTCFRTSSKVEFLRNVKMLHMDLWKVVALMNLYFGWNLLFLVINSFVYITYQLYWIFVTLQKEWDRLGVIEGGVSLTYGVVSLYILIISCQSCSLEVDCFIENIEHYAFWTSDIDNLHTIKLEIFHQVNNLPMKISANNFFYMNLQLLGNVLTSCCMYIITFIQFFIAADTKTS